VSREAPKPSGLLLAILAAFIAAGPAATQLMLPALPAVQETFGASTGAVQLNVSLSFFFMAVATLAWGPASDRFGRRPIAIAGLVVFIAGSVVCWVAPTLTVLIFGRVVQAIGAASGGIARAIVQDVYGAAGAARALALVGMAMALAPMVAAIAGGLITDAFGWRANFIGIAGIGVVMLLLAIFSLRESRLVATQSASDAWLPLRKPVFHLYALQSALSMGAFFAFIAGAPHMIVTELALPASAYGLVFVAGGVGYALGGLVSARASAQGIDRLVMAGALVAALASIALASLLVLDWSPLWAVSVVCGFVGLGIGIVQPNAQAGAVAAVPEAAGSASGTLGFLQLLTGAAVAQVVGVLMTHSALAMPLAMALLGAATWLIALPRALTSRPFPPVPSAAAPR
jgi:DHA1 family bicyclomycin/chloramphenicol resistance-like MFS transporter